MYSVITVLVTVLIVMSNCSKIHCIEICKVSNTLNLAILYIDKISAYKISNFKDS